LPEEWLIERNQQVGANSRNLLSPSFVAVCRIFAAAFRTLRYIFVTVLDSDCKGEAAVIPKSLCPRLKGFLSASRKLFGLGLQADSGSVVQDSGVSKTVVPMRGCLKPAMVRTSHRQLIRLPASPNRSEFE